MKWVVFTIIAILVLIDVSITILIGWIPVAGDFVKIVTEVIIEMISIILTAYVILTRK